MPGFGGMALLNMAAKLDVCSRGVILVGGLPEDKSGITQYKAPFSPADVIEEYTRPARVRKNGQTVIMPALSGLEKIALPDVGLLEAFNTDGLRTLLFTCGIPDLSEKTLRYPGHAEQMRLLSRLGFFSDCELDFAGARIKPLLLASRLLFEEWKLMPGEREFTVMRVEAEGEKDGLRTVMRMDLLDRTDAETGDSSMARTTGMPSVIAAKMLAAGRIIAKGIVPAELIGRDEALFAEMLAGLSKEGVKPEFSEV